MRIKALLLALVLLWPIGAVYAGTIPTEVTRNITNAALVGQGDFRFLFFDLYEARLYAPRGQYRPQEPVALELIYARRLYGDRIAKASIDEMRRMGVNDEKILTEWGQKMTTIFPDVNKGTRLVGSYRPQKGTRFYRDGQFIGQVMGDNFAKAFFGIWLDENTRAPRLRTKLIGGAK